ncbi:WD40-repeat-containing domain protein [Abortiporus biennis]|nr:WD40-repeat-containing domain protein [Abortiporus biennis]
MPPSDSEDEAQDDLEFDRMSDADEDIEDDILDALEGELTAAAEEASEPEDDSDSDDSDNNSDYEEVEDRLMPQSLAAELEVAIAAVHPEGSIPPSPMNESPLPVPPKSPTPPIPRKRSLSPAQIRHIKLFEDLRVPRSYTVEAICAIPHPVPTHSLASSLCMTHLLTGSDDGYIRDYDIFSAVNGKLFLTAPQRHHCGVMEGLMKAAPIRCWWENPGLAIGPPNSLEEVPLSAPYSLLMHSDALWSLAGSEQGHINLFTVRHEPGRLCHVMPGHRGPVSSLAMEHDEKGFFSAGWDGEAYQWDLNTGQVVRNFKSHGSQLTAIAVRPLVVDFNGNAWNPADHAYLNANPPVGEMVPETPNAPPAQEQPFVPDSDPNDFLAQSLNSMMDLPTDTMMQTESVPPPPHDSDSRSDKSDFDPLFDDPDADGETDLDKTTTGFVFGQPTAPAPSNPSSVIALPQQSQRVVSSTGAGAKAPKNAPPILDPVSYASFSPDVLMIASIDGQISLWDKRVNSPGRGVGRLWMSEKTPPWCVSACWSADGSQIYAGRRNGTIDIHDVRQFGPAIMGTPRVLKTLKNPASSGVVSCVVAFPDGRHLACASNDNIRLWNVAEAGEPDAFGKLRSGVQFKIIPGHHGGFISQMLVDRAARFLVSSSSNRGWFGDSTRTVFVHEIKHLH